MTYSLVFFPNIICFYILHNFFKNYILSGPQKNKLKLPFPRWFSKVFLNLLLQQFIYIIVLKKLRHLSVETIENKINIPVSLYTI